MKVAHRVGASLALVVSLSSPISAQICANCEARTAHSVELVIPEDQGGIPGTPLDFLVDGTGITWVLFPAQQPVLFSATGEYLGPVGMMGSGPGEFGYPGALFAIPGDSVAIVDARNRRVTIVGPDRRAARSVRMTYPIARAQVVSWPDSVVISAVIPGQTGAARLLHMADFRGDEIRVTGSFGGSAEPGVPGTPLHMMRHLAASGDQVTSVDLDRLRAQSWTRAGEMLEERDVDLVWFDDPLANPGPMPDGVDGFHHDPESDLTWIIASDVDPTVLESIFEEARAAGRQEITGSDLPPPSSYRETHLVALDADSQLHADMTLDGYAVRVGPDGTLLVARTGPFDTVRLFLERVDLSGGP